MIKLKLPNNGELSLFKRLLAMRENLCNISIRSDSINNLDSVLH